MDISHTSLQSARPGKSAQSIGHQAKAAVEIARANDTELPKNAQGAAASAIARGADPQSVLAANLAINEPSVTESASPEPTVDPTEPDLQNQD